MPKHSRSRSKGHGDDPSRREKHRHHDKHKSKKHSRSPNHEHSSNKRDHRSNNQEKYKSSHHSSDSFDRQREEKYTKHEGSREDKKSNFSFDKEPYMPPKSHSNGSESSMAPPQTKKVSRFSELRNFITIYHNIASDDSLPQPSASTQQSQIE